jgi:hypothetical protein
VISNHAFNSTPLDYLTVSVFIPPGLKFIPYAPTCAYPCASSLSDSNTDYGQCINSALQSQTATYHYGDFDIHMEVCDCKYISPCESACPASLESVLWSSYITSGCSTISSMARFNQTGLTFVTTPPTTTTPDTYTFSASATPTNALGFISLLSSPVPVPNCVRDMSRSCPQSEKPIYSCWDQHGNDYTFAECYCAEISSFICTDICVNGLEPMDYVLWTKKVCSWNGVSNSSFEEWTDLDLFLNQAHENLFPWSLEIDNLPDNRSHPNHTRSAFGPANDRICPSKFNKLGSFALVNFIVFVCSAFVCRRTVIQALSCNRLGTPGSPWWFGLGALSALLNVLSNVAGAFLVHSVPGYKHVPIFALALLWCSRPRISWAIVLLVHLEKEKSMYFSAGASALASEMILQSFGAVYLFRTVNFAARNGYYNHGNIIHQVDGGRSAMLMYSGALLWTVTVGGAILQIIWSFLGLGDLVRKLLGQLGEWMAKKNGDFASTFTRRKEEIEAKLRQRVLVRIAPHIPNVQAHLAKLVKQFGLSKLNNTEQFEASQHPGHIIGTDEGYTISPGEISWIEALHKMGLNPERLIRIQKVALWMALPFIGQWMFWIGFVDLMGDE